MKLFGSKSGVVVRHDDQRRLLSLPEQTRIQILKNAADAVAFHPWAEAINVEKNHQKVVEIVEEFMPKKELAKAKAEAEETTASTKTVKGSTSTPDKLTELLLKIEDIHNAS